MTTIVFKDGILAADTRSTRAVLSNHHCLDCGSTRRGNDNVAKIITFNEKLVAFLDERLVAAASSGDVGWGDMMMEMLKAEENIFTFNKRMAQVLSVGVFEDNSGVIVIVTDKHVYKYSPTVGPARVDVPIKELQVYPLDTTQVIAIGSGGQYAYAVAALLQQTAVEACGVAGQCDPATNLIVNWIDCNHSENGIQTTDFKSQGFKTHYKL